MSQPIEKNTETSDEISKFTYQYLLDNLDPEFYASDFSQEYFESLLAKLVSEFGEEKTHFRIKTIRSCILNHFRNFFQDCEITISQGKIKVKNLLPEGIKTVAMNKAMIAMSVNLNKLVKDKNIYALQEHLLCYHQSIVQTLYQKFHGTPLEGDAAGLRDIIRASVKTDFELDRKDIVLFLRKNLYIRYFVDLRNMNTEDNRRFLGVSSEDLAPIYKERFPENFEEILLEMAPEVIKDTLNFGKIDNFTFKATYVEVFRTLVDVAMVEYTSSLDKETVLALNGYILRLYFDQLLYVCAQILIDMVLKRDRKADTFLRFYNGETIVEKGGKNIKKPFIVDVKQNIWNYSSIFSVMTQCLQYENKYKQQKSSLSEVEEAYRSTEQLLNVSKENEKVASKELSLIKDEIHACTLVKNNLLSIKKPSKDESSQLLQKKKEEKNLLEKHDKSFSQRNEFMLKLENARVAEKSRLKQLETQKKLMSDLEKKGEELYAQQDNIFSAIAKALIFR